MCSTQDNTSAPASSSDYFETRDSFNCSEDLSPHAAYYTPELSDVKEEIRWGFMLHSYGFACMFFFLAFYAFFSILNLRSQLSTRPYMSTINSFLCLLGICRSGILFIDPYGLQKTLPALLGSLLWELGYPCLISSFSLIQIAFLQLTQLDLGPERLRKKTCLSVVITVHFVSVIASAIYTNINVDLAMLKLMTQLIFTIWGLFLFGSFLYAGKCVLGVMGSSGSSNEGSSLTSHNDKGSTMGILTKYINKSLFALLPDSRKLMLGSFQTYLNDMPEPIKEGQTVSEFQLMLKNFGITVPDETVQEFINSKSRSGAGSLTENDFIGWVGSSVAAIPDDASKDLMAAFRVFDKDGNGFITRDELKEAMEMIGEPVTDEDIDNMITMADLNKDGKIDYKEFSKLLG